MKDKIIELLEDKINEAENYEEEELGKEFIEGYINGLKMAVNIVEDVIGYEESLKKAIKKNKMKEQINKEFERVSNVLGKTILGADYEEGLIGRKSDIIKKLEEEIEYCKMCIKNEDDEFEIMQDNINMIEKFIKEIGVVILKEDNNVIGIRIHPMDNGLYLISQEEVLEDLKNWI